MLILMLSFLYLDLLEHVFIMVSFVPTFVIYFLLICVFLLLRRVSMPLLAPVL